MKKLDGYYHYHTNITICSLRPRFYAWGSCQIKEALLLPARLSRYIATGLIIKSV